MAKLTGKEFVEGLKRVAEWYEENPDFPMPSSYGEGVFTVFTYSAEDFEKWKDELGTVLMEADDYSMRAYKTFGDVQLSVYANRSNVCTKKVIGTKMVTQKVATQWTEKEVEEEITEWECPEGLIPEGKKE